MALTGITFGINSGPGLAKPVTPPDTQTPLDARCKLVIAENTVQKYHFLEIAKAYPHMKIHVHKSNADGTETCIGVYEVDTVKKGKVTNTTKTSGATTWDVTKNVFNAAGGAGTSYFIDTYHQVYSSTSGLYKDYSEKTIKKTYSNVATAKADSTTKFFVGDTFKIGNYCYYIFSLTGIGDRVELSYERLFTEGESNIFCSCMEYQKHKDVIYYCTDNTAPYKGKVYFNNAKYGGDDLPIASSSELGGIQIGYEETGNNYALKLNNKKAYVTVPNYILPTASSDTKGGVKIGNGLEILSEKVSIKSNGTSITVTSDGIKINDTLKSQYDLAYQKASEFNAEIDTIKTYVGYKTIGEFNIKYDFDSDKYYIEDNNNICNVTETTHITESSFDNSYFIFIAKQNITIDSNFKLYIKYKQDEEYKYSTYHLLTGIANLISNCKYIFKYSISYNTFILESSISELRKDIYDKINAQNEVINLLKENIGITNTNVNLLTNFALDSSGKLQHKGSNTNILKELNNIYYSESSSNKGFLTIYVKTNLESGTVVGQTISIYKKTDTINAIATHTITDDDRISNKNYNAKKIFELERGINYIISVDSYKNIGEYVTPDNKELILYGQTEGIEFQYNCIPTGFSIHVAKYINNEWDVNDIPIENFDSSDSQYAEYITFKNSSNQSIIFGIWDEKIKGIWSTQKKEPTDSEYSYVVDTFSGANDGAQSRYINHKIIYDKLVKYHNDHSNDGTLFKGSITDTVFYKSENTILTFHDDKGNQKQVKGYTATSSEMNLILGSADVKQKLISTFEKITNKVISVEGVSVSISPKCPIPTNSYWSATNKDGSLADCWYGSNWTNFTKSTSRGCWAFFDLNRT